MRESPCKSCDKRGCHGECENYILGMVEHNVERNCFDRLFKEIPKFNYVLNEKINAIFGTDLEVASKPTGDAIVSEKNTVEFEKLLYAKNGNRQTNMHEIKRAVREKEIFGESYLFYDTKNLYALSKSEIGIYRPKKQDPILDSVLFYTVGAVDLPEHLVFPKEGFIKQDYGYIISPENMFKFKSESYVLNSDLRQLQILLEINRKIYSSTTARDFGDLFLFTTAPQKNIVSAVAERTKETINKAVKKMREYVTGLIGSGKTEDSHVIALDETYRDVKQVKPVTLVKDYQFIWENQDDIITSVFNFPMLLSGLGDEAGNVSKEELLKEARANTLTPIKSDVANVLSDLAKKLFGEEYYLRFQEYSEVNADYDGDTKDTKTQ